MAIQVTIDSITGVTPYDVYICQADGTGCFYINTITSTPYIFDIPQPNDTASEYMLKIIDGQNCQITATQSVL